MPAVKTYTRVNFQNYPSTSTPLNATNLNKMDKGIDDLDDEVVTVKNAIENMSFDADSISYDNTSSGLQATDVQDAVDEINDNLSGFKFYPTGTGIVGLIADDSAYTDADGNYVVWGTATANQLVEDNPNTYKSVPSEEDTRGKVGADSATPFSKADKRLEWLFEKYVEGGTTGTAFNKLDADAKYIVMNFACGGANPNIKVNNVSIFSQIDKIATPPVERYDTYSLIKFPIKKGDKLELTSPTHGSNNYQILMTSGEIEEIATYKHSNDLTTSVFTADKKYKELYVYVAKSRMLLQSSTKTSYVLAYPYITSVGNSTGYFYKFFNVEVGDTITFYNQYAGNGNMACVFVVK